MPAAFKGRRSRVAGFQYAGQSPAHRATRAPTPAHAKAIFCRFIRRAELQHKQRTKVYICFQLLLKVLKFNKGLLFLLLWFGGNLRAQTAGEMDTVNLSRYHQYRIWLREGFVSVGLEAGESLPMMGRNRLLPCDSHWILQLNGCALHEGRGLLYWADGTYVLGQYTAMLALEIANGRRAGWSAQRLEASVYELYCALRAFERLDAAAGAATDGFFMRDDVPMGFYWQGDRQPDRRFLIDSLRGYECVASSFVCRRPNEGVRGGGYMSQDQLIMLLLAWCTLAELLPELEYKGIVLADLARQYADRAVHYCVVSNWRLRDDKGQAVPDKWGGNLSAFSYHIALAARRICGQQYRPTYQSSKSKTMGRSIAGLMQFSWGAQTIRNRALFYALAILEGKWSAGLMYKRSLRSDQLIYSLWHAALNGEKTGAPKDSPDYWRRLLYAAPNESMPCFASPDCKAAAGWRSLCRWTHPDHKDGNPYGWELEYNGIDYMLAYNLFHWHFGEALPKYE